MVENAICAIVLTEIVRTLLLRDTGDPPHYVNTPSPKCKQETTHLDVDKKVPQTIRASIVTLPPPSPQMGNARLNRPPFSKRGLPYMFQGKR